MCSTTTALLIALALEAGIATPVRLSPTTTTIKTKITTG